LGVTVARSEKLVVRPGKVRKPIGRRMSAVEAVIKQRLVKTEKTLFVM
jgi:hypothetical protein